MFQMFSLKNFMFNPLNNYKKTIAYHPENTGMVAKESP
jgi:hypothetical protein